MDNTYDVSASKAMMLHILNYSCTLVLLGYYVATTIFTWLWPTGEKIQPISRRRKIALVALSVLITLIYAAKALTELIAGREQDDSLIHCISQTLFWLALMLMLTVTEVPRALVYVGIAVMNLVLEVSICLIESSEIWQARISLPFEVVLLVALAAFVPSAAMFQLAHDEDLHGDETQSLLNNDSSRSNRSSFEVVYGSQHTETSDNGSDEDSDSENEDEDEKSIKAARKQQLETVGWIGYVKAFKVLVPYVFPLHDRRLQLYMVIHFINLVIKRVLNVLYPRQLGIIIDRLTTERQVPWKDLVLWTLFAIIRSSCCGIEAINEMLEHRFTAWSRRELMSASLNHVMNLSMKFHDQKDSGEVIKAIEQAASLNNLLQVLVLQLMPAGVDILIAMWYVTYLFDVYALFILIAMMILFVFVTYHITVIATIARRLQSRKERDESKLIFESVGNWFTISCFNRRDHMMSRLSHVIKSANVAFLWNEDLYTYLFAVQELLEYIGRFGVTALAATRIVQGVSSVGTLVTLESYWDTITSPLYILCHRYREVNSSLVDSERILQLFQEQPDVQDGRGSVPFQSLGGKVKFEDVRFAYGGREDILQGLSMTAEAGQTIALVGETGAGKSTIFKLLMRFFDVTGGKIEIDGQDIRDVKLDSLRECFGIVPQESVLFNMSILENVRYGRLDATDEEIYAACRAASIHDKILSFPNGYASKVGERGVKLSGGERQRIAIARVFLKDPQIILLDEATSAMDSQTESVIQDALRRLSRGRTTIVIAHRLSTVVEADQIFVIDKGQVVENGSHAELLRSGGKYFQLWSKQAALPASRKDE